MNQKKWEQLTFADDFMFGKIMVNPDICKEVLERILNIKIERIEYIERQKNLDVDYEAKSIRMDVYVKDGKGTLDDASPELKAFLNYVSTGIPSDDTFVKRLDEEVKKARTNRKWRREYMKYHVNMMIAKRQGLKQGDILRQISQIRTIHDKKLSMDMYTDFFDIDVSQIKQIQQLITQHPNWNDEQIYDALYSRTDD